MLHENVGKAMGKAVGTVGKSIHKGTIELGAEEYEKQWGGTREIKQSHKNLFLFVHMKTDNITSRPNDNVISICDAMKDEDRTKVNNENRARFINY